MGLGAGQIALDTDLAAIRAASDLKPIVRCTRSGTQSMADNTLTIVDWNAEDFDTHGFHSTVTNPSRVTPTIAGIYRATWAIFLAGNGTYSTIRTLVRKNGATILVPSTQWGATASAVTHMWTGSMLVDMNGTTDYLEVGVLQDNTGNVAVNLQSASPNIPTFEVEFVRGPA